MGGDVSLTGPDLAAGVALDTLAGGALVRGHAFGEAILLSMQDGDVSAVGAICTHYNGPLDEGLKVGATVRCPWHHACFDLRTGAPLRAPALRPLPRYTTSVADGVVRVTGRMDPPKPQPRKGAPRSIVIVGGGAAAAAAVETLRREGHDGPVTLVTREGGVPVDRPNLSKDYLAGTAPEEWMPLRDEASYAEMGVTLHTGEATALDPSARTLHLVDGTRISWDACVIATGAQPIRLPTPGADRPNVFVLRTLADSRAIIAAAAGARRAVVIGASFIGLEVAASLRSRGLEIILVGPESTPLEKALGVEVGAFVRRVHEHKGVVFRLGRTAKVIDEGSVLLSDGERVDADLVVMGVGVRPNVQLAEKAGLTTDNGILVDATLRTSAPGVLAAGDVARWPDPHTGRRQRIEHWVLAQRQGETAARNLLGAEETFDAVPFFWSVHYDDTIRYVGFPGGERAEVDGDLDARDAAIAYRTGDTTFAVATIGRDRVALEAELLLERDDQAGLRNLVRAG
jgi:NADPH-dependent 2,4-dienoyl-CoA reductase/sulfur reductase-like enzyme/nitrite reductase/ring-hydroxylating ferredoxin subunit